MTDLSVVIVSWNTRALVLGGLEALLAELDRCASARGLKSELWLVDNGSTDGTPEAVAERFPRVGLALLERNRGFAAGANEGIRRSQGRFVLLLNSDARPCEGAIECCVDVLARRPQVGAVGPQLLHADGRLQNSVHVFPSFASELLPRWLPELLWPSRYPSKRRPPSEPTPVDAVQGAALFARREAIDAVGPLCEDYFFFLEETDWCWRLRQAGWQVLYVPAARVVHASGASSKRRDPAATRIEYNRSLLHFLRTRRGVTTMRLVAGLRLLGTLLSVLLLAAAAPFSGRLRARLRERWQVLRWYGRGRPEDAGLRDL